MLETLYTYCIPIDDGAAPNPYWGICTLNICKPVIRRSANIGDWVVGTGSLNSPIGNIGGQVVYAMKVTGKMTMKEYDDYTKERLREKIPDRGNADKRRWLGDSIYNFSFNPPRLRKSVHSKGNMATDLRGESTLLSKEFLYFGDRPKPLSAKLMPIVNQGQGHRSQSNAGFVKDFEEWLYGLGYKPCALLGKPQLDVFRNEQVRKSCAVARAKEAEEDEESCKH